MEDRGTKHYCLIANPLGALRRRLSSQHVVSREVFYLIMGSTDIEPLLADGKNKTTIFCARCPSKILCPNVGTYIAKEFPLPQMHHKAEGDPDASEDVKDYWQVADMYHFENIGFSKTVDDRKYLICADCEIGPIGWHDLTSKMNYLALSRVKHSDS